MKKIFYTLLCLCVLTTVHAQYPKGAQEFTAVDLDGKEHSLFEYLEAGKVVILDLSTTWCPPCWAMHETHALENIHKAYGPEGTDQVVVLFYEGDPSTTIDDLNGTGSNTLGDWLSGSSYTFFNETTVRSEFVDLYAPEGWPTINVIDPATKQIIADVWDRTENQMIEIFEPYLSTVSNVNDTEINFSVSPNPTTGVLNIDIQDVVGQDAYMQIFDQLGSLKETISVSDLEGQSLDMSDYNAGRYMIKVVSDKNISTKLVVKL